MHQIEKHGLGKKIRRYQPAVQMRIARNQPTAWDAGLGASITSPWFTTEAWDTPNSLEESHSTRQHNLLPMKHQIVDGLPLRRATPFRVSKSPQQFE